MSLLPVALFGLPLGCGSNISNSVFYDDADFLNALPGPEYFRMDYPTEFAVGSCDEGSEATAIFACLTQDSLDSGDAYLGFVTTLTDVVRSLAPTTRGEDLRVWGPGDWMEEAPGYFLRVEMSRSPTQSTYSWAFQVSENSDGPWDLEVIYGTHTSGELDVAAGIGDLTLDLTALEAVVETGTGGEVHVDYDVRELTWLRVTSTGIDAGEEELLDSEWTHQETEEGGGDFTFGTRLDVAHTPTPEEVALRVRWTEFGEGRGDALLFGGDLGVPPRTANQCWDPTGLVTWHTDELGWYPDEGDEADCAFDEAAYPATETDSD